MAGDGPDLPGDRWLADDRSDLYDRHGVDPADADRDRERRRRETERARRRRIRAESETARAGDHRLVAAVAVLVVLAAMGAVLAATPVAEPVSPVGAGGGVAGFVAVSSSGGDGGRPDCRRQAFLGGPPGSAVHRRRRTLLVVLVGALFLVAGCSDAYRAGDPANRTADDPTATGVVGTPEGSTTTDGATTGGTTTDGTTDRTTADDRTPRPDPDGDPIGWEGGYWATDPVAVDPADGYNRTEIDRVTARASARIERIREREFDEEVGVEVISRAEYRERAPFDFRSTPERNAVWEALFVVGEDRDAADALQGVYNGSVAGYYAGGQIVLVSDEVPVDLDRNTLVHELTHALQDQQFGFGYPTTSRDARLAARAVTEGEANYVMDRYADRCGTEWSCVPQVGRGSNASYDVGVFLTVFLPYSDGPTFVERLVERGGWEAVDRAWENRPVSTEQVIHPERYPDETPVEVTVEDRSTGDWRRTGDGETVGEASLYVALRVNGVVPEGHLRSDERRYNYSYPATDGWAGDRVVVYRSDRGRLGYVFRTEWDSRKEAREFLAAYRQLLDARNASQVREGVYRIPDSDPFGDAFRVTRRGTTVTVVNAPTVAALSAVHPRRSAADRAP